MAYCCPNCGSRDIVCTEKGYSVGKGLLGIVTFGLVGGLAGLHGSKRLVWRCPHCNGCFSEPAQAGEPSQQEAAPAVPAMPEKVRQQRKPVASSTSKPPVVKSRLVCTCGAYNSIYAKACFSCGAEISLATCTSVPSLPNKGIVCQCGVKNSITNKHCTACGQWLDYSQLVQQDGQPKYNSQQCPHCGESTPAKSRKVQYCAHCGKPL